MDNISENNIDFRKLNRLQVTSNESALWHDNINLYKIFRNVAIEELKQKQRKLKLLVDFEHPNVLTADTLIYDGMKLSINFSGYIRKYIAGKTLYKFFEENKTSLFLKLIKEVSITLRQIHNDPRNIVVGDLHFGNILIDENLKHYFIDVDSYSVDGIKGLSFPYIFKSYSEEKGVYKDFASKLSKETDKLNLLMLFIYIMFGEEKHPVFIPIDDYDAKAEQLETLKNIRKYLLQIQKTDIYIPDIPYLDELISNKDILKK